MGSFSSSSSITKNSFLRTLSRQGEALNIDCLTENQLKDTISSIERIRIPFFDNIHLQTISNVVYVTGNSPFHEGLIIITNKNRIYVTQTYPITFQLAFSYDDAINKISSFCSMNRNTKNNEIRDVWIPKIDIYIKDVIYLINILPNKYDIIKENCQNYCKTILNYFPLIKIIINRKLNNNKNKDHDKANLIFNLN